MVQAATVQDEPIEDILRDLEIFVQVRSRNPEVKARYIYGLDRVRSLIRQNLDARADATQTDTVATS